MKIKTLHQGFFLLVVLSVLVLPVSAFCQEHHMHDAGNAPAGQEGNPLREEMMKLDAPGPVKTVVPVSLTINANGVKVKAGVLRSLTMTPGLFSEPGKGMKFGETSDADRKRLSQKQQRGSPMNSEPLFTIT